MFSPKPITLSKPKGYTIFASLISRSGFLNGYDTGSIGAITSMPSFTSKIGDLSPLLRGFTVSLIMMTGAMPSIFGGTGMEAGADELGFLYHQDSTMCITRNVRLATTIHVTAGVCAGYFTCFGSARLESSMSWRAPFIVQSLPAVVLAAFCAYFPDSPRWLLHKGRREEALQALERLEIENEEAEKDILVPVPVSVDYVPTLFETAGLPGKTSTFLASGVSAILMVAITIPATFTMIDGGVVHQVLLAVSYYLRQCSLSAHYIFQTLSTPMGLDAGS
ncbi:hypothetical protein BPOR_0001g00080 [Botrytis porri]|uniref:Major facilitator superfamily (MFS) profile domain-containing protein n=1 Tax=Botrytis porri TaxID=87229 RepID=A0A4Z1L7A6_9HELO|nr:hypothetical protein BPOR_0001g00080 [Botrytis porri]